MKTSIQLISIMLLISGCGNPDLESAVYIENEGVIRCPECVSTIHDYHFGHYLKEAKEKGVVPKWEFVTDESFSCEKCFDDLLQSKCSLDKHEIQRVTSSKGKVSGVWVVTLYTKCKYHGLVSTSIEYRYTEGKITPIKPVLNE